MVVDNHDSSKNSDVSDNNVEVNIFHQTPQKKNQSKQQRTNKSTASTMNTPQKATPTTLASSPIVTPQQPRQRTPDYQHCYTPPCTNTTLTRTPPNNHCSTKSNTSNDRILKQQGLIRKLNTIDTLLVQTEQTPVAVSFGSVCTKTPNTSRKNISTQDNSFSDVSINAVTAESLQPVHGWCAPSSQYRTVYLVRHGESLGQIATTHDRRCNTRLLDCGLSPTGIRQSNIQLRQYFQNIPIDMIVCSPLTRAIQTAILAFGTKQTTTEVRSTKHQDKCDDDGIIPNKHTPKILIHYHLREMGSNIPENQPRTMKQVRDSLIRNKTIVDKDEWDALMDTTTLVPPPPEPRTRYQSFSPSLVKTTTYHHNPTNVNNDNNNNDHTNNDNVEDALPSTTTTICASWPYKSNNYNSSNSSMNTDTMPNVLRRNYIQYMFHWLASYCRDDNTNTDNNNNNNNDETTNKKNAIVIVCHYHVIRAALSYSYQSSSNETNSYIKSTTKVTPNKSNISLLPSSTAIKPQNAQPIKCYLCLRTGQLTLAK